MQDSYELSVEGVRVGDILAEKYQIERVLGVGGMGVVVAARHLQLDELVAIKYLLPAALEHPSAVFRFLREAKAAVRIKSEHVARVSDVGTLACGAPYLVMEYLEGQDLAQMLRQQGPMAVEQAVEFVLQALEAIADAHGLGIIHRDLKPANLYCVRRSDGLLSIKVLDFGISKTNDPGLGEVGAITAPATVMGSPLYMSPEQMRSARDVDVRTDIWAIGVILYQLVTGEAPFVGHTISEICEKATTLSPVSPRSLRPDVPSELEAVILKCLEKERDQRYSNVAELAVKLLPFAPSRARASVERIARIISTAGIQPPASELIPSSQAQPSHLQTVTDGNFGHTKSRVQLGSNGVRLAVLVSLAVTAALLLWRVGAEEPPIAKPLPALTAAAAAEQTASGITVEPIPTGSTSAALPSDAKSTGTSQTASSQTASSQGARGAAVSTASAGALTARPAIPQSRAATARSGKSRVGTAIESDLFDSPH